MASRQVKREDQQGQVHAPAEAASADPSSSAPASAGSSSIGGGRAQGQQQPHLLQPQQHPRQKPIRRRMRMITSCLECRRRKLRCDKNQPCGNCVKFGRECPYLSPQLDEASQLRLMEIKEKVGSLERQLEATSNDDDSSVGAGDASSRNAGPNLGSGPGGSRAPRTRNTFLADAVDYDDDDEAAGLEPTDLAAVDVAYEDDADGGTDDVVDLGVLVGRMRITERVGGMSRPRLSEEISAGISGQPSQPPLGQAPPNIEFDFDFAISQGFPMDSWPEFLRPGPSYIPPSSGFMMGQASGPSSSLEHSLPTRGAADRLVQQYFDAVHPIARCLHGPSFQASYNEFWAHVHANIEPRASLQAVVFAALFSAAVSMDEATAVREFGRSQRSIYESLKLSTETALSKANFLRTTRVETLQAFVMYMIPLCREEVSRAHSVLVGAAVRMAECMGLHRDGKSYGLNALDTHVRRLIWHQLCFLDIRTCEAQGPRPAIRRDDYDTRLPLNCDEELLSPTTTEEPAASDRWTNALLPLIRSEINEMMRIIWVDRRKLEAKRTTLTAVLSKIEKFRQRMLEKYDPLLGDPATAVPLQRYSRIVMNLLLYRLHAMVLPLFHANASGAQLPPRLNRVLITAGIMIVELGVRLETDPELAPWAWYRGAYHQFQIALLLAVEVYYRPQNPEASRIWACLDYVFNTNRHLPPEARGLQILGEIMQRTALYQRMRKARASVHMAGAMLKRNALADQDEDPNKLPPHLSQSEHQQYGPSQPFNPTPSYALGLVPSNISLVNQQQQPQQQAPGPAGPQGPPPGAVYAGVSDGQTLWSAPMAPPPGEFGTSTTGITSGPTPAMAPGTGGQGHVPGVEVDWDVLNQLFVADPQTGELTISGYGDPSLGMNWQYWE